MDASQKKCSYCAMEIPKEAKICPFCRKKMPVSGKAALIIIALASIIIVWGMISATSRPSRTPSPGSDPATATHDQIFREYELCMNDAKKTLTHDKQQGQNMVVMCYSQLKKYGDQRAKKIFIEYHDHYGF